MENTEETIAGIRGLLNQCRSEAGSMSSDPIARQWNNVEIEKHAGLLADFGVNHQQVLSAIKDYRRAVDDMMQQVIRHENQLSNLEADLRLGSLATNEAHKLLLKLLVDTRELQEPLATIRRCRSLLVEAARNIQERLSFENILQLARTDAGRSNKQREIFERGYTVFKLVTPDKDCKEDFFNIHDISARADRLEAKFRKLELPPLPELAKAIIVSHMEVCHEAIKEIHLFLALIGRSLQGEIGQIDIIHQELKALKAKPFSILLASLTMEGEKLGRTIGEFQFKANFIKEIENVDLLLENIKTFYESLRYSYFPHLAVTMNQPGFSLNPRAIAAEISHDYFRGIRGLIRRLKLTFFATDGGEPLDKEILSQKIFIALSSCPYYYCWNDKDMAKIPDFIDGLIKNFTKPYPYEDLFRLIKEAITDYGSLIEKDFAQYTAEKRTAPEEEGAPARWQPQEILLGRLLVKIETGTSLLRSLQARS